MESRRDRFRRQLARLAGTGHPQEAIDAGLYVPRPTPGARLVRRIELQPMRTRVLTGPIGSGKSTELLVLARELNRLPDFWAHVIDVSLVHDLGDLREGTLIAAAGVDLQSTLGLKGKHIDHLRELAYGRPFQLDLDEPFLWEGVLTPPERESSPAWRFADVLGLMLKEVPEIGERTPVLLFDSLDRARNPSGFRTVLEKDAHALVERGFGAILTAPIDTLWTDSEALRALADTWDTLPYEDPTRDPQALSFFLDVLRRRVDPDILPESEQKALIEASGGVLRDLIELARGAVEEAYLEGRDAVGHQEVAASIAQLAHSLSLGVGTTTIETLAYVRNHRRIRTMDEATIRMLKNRQVLEHRDDSGTYYVPHPVLEPLIERSAKAS